MALPSLKAEQYHRAHRETHNHEPLPAHLNGCSDDSRPVAIVHGKKNRLAWVHDEDNNLSMGTKRVCISSDREATNDSRFIILSPNRDEYETNRDCHHEECENEIRCRARHSNSAPDLRAPGQRQSSDSSPSPTSSSSVLTQILSAHSHFNTPSTPTPDEVQSLVRPWLNPNHSYQYVLGAATSMATKLQEETMTYLNQGQPYEIKLKKLGDVTEMKGKKLKSIVRVGFHERRLQFMENELLSQWRQHRNSERILEVDIPLSYGILDVSNDPQTINKCSFIWDPTKEAGVFIKVNCISTEFTPKKHGGEKGVPFRLIIETHSVIPDGPSRPPSETILHAASSQVKVFKPKGADRKHKTDREKMMKRRTTEQDKYRPSYECTDFTDVSLDTMYWPVPTVAATTTIVTEKPSSVVVKESEPLDYTKQTSEPRTVETPPESPTISSGSISCPLRPDACPSETIQWLKTNRFDLHIKTLSSFCGADLLRLNRGDLIQICGTADGIRLFNALNSTSIRPKVTIFVRSLPDEDFSAVYLELLTISELKSKLAAIYPNAISISRLRLTGPKGIMVQVTDEVIKNLPPESMFLVNFEKGMFNNCYCNDDETNPDIPTRSNRVWFLPSQFEQLQMNEQSRIVLQTCIVRVKRLIILLKRVTSLFIE